MRWQDFSEQESNGSSRHRTCHLSKSTREELLSLLLNSRLTRQGRLQKKKVKRLSTTISERLYGLDPMFGMKFSTILSLG